MHVQNTKYATATQNLEDFHRIYEQVSSQYDGYIKKRKYSVGFIFGLIVAL